VVFQTVGAATPDSLPRGGDEWAPEVIYRLRAYHKGPLPKRLLRPSGLECRKAPMADLWPAPKRIRCAPRDLAERIAALCRAGGDPAIVESARLLCRTAQSGGRRAAGH